MAAEVLGQSLHLRWRTADEKYELMRILTSHFPLAGNHADGRRPCRGLSGPFPFSNAWQPASRPPRSTPVSPRISETMTRSAGCSLIWTRLSFVPACNDRCLPGPGGRGRQFQRDHHAMGCRWEVREISQTRSASSGPNRSTSVQPSAPQMADGRA